MAVVIFVLTINISNRYNVDTVLYKINITCLCTYNSILLALIIRHFKFLERRYFYLIYFDIFLRLYL